MKYLMLLIAAAVHTQTLAEQSAHIATPTTPTAPVSQAEINAVLTQQTRCNATIEIRSQGLSSKQLADACAAMIAEENHFHHVFGTRGQPVADDNNQRLRANIYESREAFVQYATTHFNMSTDNGGMYLEGLPHRENNQAEFVAYQKKGQVWNLHHEYVHYLDGRFNAYGDFCKNLHDSHSGPEFCPKPAPALPHLVWWNEGVAEYIAKKDDNPKALLLAQTQQYRLSELFNTSYEQNGGGDRVYRWGYLAVRFMIEHQREQVDSMLALTRQGDYKGYQQLVKAWGTRFDSDFVDWLNTLNQEDTVMTMQ